jgi:predicted transcriptional regulator
LSRNRSRLDIVRDMLNVAVVGVRKTRIMYGANLNYVQVDSYLKGLLGSGLVELNGALYLITQRGLQFLQSYADYLARCKRIKEEALEAAKGRRMLECMCFDVDC